jgi:pilus assembly protein FimV
MFKLTNRILAGKQIAAAIAFALCASIGQVHAAGLGRLTVQSALGQQLSAELEITALDGKEGSSLTARLAPETAFREVGLAYNPVLRSLRFSVERRADGKPVVRIVSPRPLNEPFVEMLVELSWAGGRYVREYTFLLDPPELRMGKTETLAGRDTQQPAVVSAPVARVRPLEQKATPPAVAPARPGSAQKPLAQVRPADAAPTVVEVKRGDTLNAIARQVRPDGVSLDQTLISLYQANPSAFFGSIHQLRAGASLQIPDRQVMASVDQAEARQQIRIQTRDFNAYRARLAAQVRTLPADKAGRAASGSVTARVEEKDTGADAADQLRLSKSGDASGSGAVTGKTGSASSKTAGVEQKVARDAALKESESRVADLEKNVSDLQKLLELKNRQLAELQKNQEAQAAAGKSVTGSIVQAPATPVKAGPATAAVGAPVQAPAPAEAGKPADGKKADAAQPDKSPDAPKPAVASQAKPATAKPVASKPAPAPAPEPSFIDDLTDNPLMLPGIGAILALAAGYGWYAMRRRRRDEAFEDSLIDSEGFATNSLFGTTGGQSVDTSESVFGTSIQDSGVDVHPTEVDPIAEAEVYVAYGRDAQAEEILVEALRRQPDRQAIRAKLLEIYANREETESFNETAAEMYEMTGGQTEDWGKIVSMGYRLDPGNPLYAQGQSDDFQSAPAAAGAARSSSADDDDADFQAFLNTRIGEPVEDTQTLSVAPESMTLPGPQVAWDQDETVARPAPRETSPAEPMVDFNVLKDTSAMTADVAPVGASEDARNEAAPTPDRPAFDFDIELPRLDSSVEPSGPQAEDRSSPASALEQAVDGRFDLPSLDLPTGATPSDASQPLGQPAPSAGFGELSLELPDADQAPRPASLAAEQSPAANFDFSSISLELEQPPVSSAGSVTAEEFETKLELASAYQEIGDAEGARDLLNEVMRAGSDEQKAKAQQLLGKLG